MDYTKIIEILEKVRSGNLSPREAYNSIISVRYKETDHALLDYERPIRTGFAEAVYSKDKSPEQIVSIVKQLHEDKKPIIATKLEKSHIKELKKLKFDELIIYEDIGISTAFGVKGDNKIGKVVVVAGGTSDYKIAEECSITAEFYGSKVDRIYDVGIAGIHRLISKLERLRDSNVIVAVAGMEGTLPSVVAGLVTSPVIAVPTSVGYGSSFGGLSALLTMLNSCASGISVVNIDNGFGAGYQANLINTLIETGKH